MRLQKNEGYLDRGIRLFAFEFAVLAAIFWIGGWAQILLYVFSAILLFTGLTGFCGLYKLFGWSTVGKNKLPSKIVIAAAVVVFIAIAVAGAYYSVFFTRKFFLDDYNRMNNFYKQTLFFTGQEKRAEAGDNYSGLVAEYAVFNAKYQKYHPYAIWNDNKFNDDLTGVSALIAGLKDTIKSGDLKTAHTELEKVRPVFQDILKRNDFSMLAVALVDFHDAMEKIIEKADAKDAAGLMAVYPEVDAKLKEVESQANDAEIQAIRAKLDAVYNLAKEGQTEALSAKAAELKSSFVKVYLKRG